MKCGSRETTTKHGMSGKGGSVVVTEGKTGSEVMDKYNDEIRVNESADSSMVTQGKKNMTGEDDKAIAGFDLNEDLNKSELKDCVQPVLPFVSSHSVIHVVAKPGIPSGRWPMTPLKFEGGLGWKGTAQTSAFCSTNHGPNSRVSLESTSMLTLKMILLLMGLQRCVLRLCKTLIQKLTGSKPRQNSQRFDNDFSIKRCKRTMYMNANPEKMEGLLEISEDEA